jgi:1-acyl-sn-glycerol-3-phosphate acyltransferase
MSDHANTPPSSLPIPQRLFYRFFRGVTRTLMQLMFRAYGRHAYRVPATGAVLIAANHQAYLDPPLVGGFVRFRECHFLARAGLFTNKWFGWIITGLNSVPISEDGSDLSAIKEILRRLELGEAVVIFPEGSRTSDGAMHPFKRGVSLLVKKSSCPVVPVAVEGCFDAWPRGGKVKPFRARIAVMYGHPIPHDELMKDGPDAALRRLERDIDAMRLELRREMRETSGGVYPLKGLGDLPFNTAPIAASS